jgi:regulatory protein
LTDERSTTIWEEKAPAKKKPRNPRKVSRQRLERWALSYLDRFSTTRANLRCVLLRRARKSCAFHEMEMTQPEIWIDEVVQKLTEQGYLDDRRYAQGLIRRLRRRGASVLKMKSQLQEKGLDSEWAEELLLEDESPGDGGLKGIELRSAYALAKRRKLGPFRTCETQRSERRDKDRGVFARAGFSWSVTAAVLEAESLEILEAEIGEGPGTWG